MKDVDPRLLLLREISKDRGRKPYLIGKVGNGPEMYNTYYTTKNGFLIPCPKLFFSDSYRNPTSTILSHSRNSDQNEAEFFDELLMEGRLSIDEVLAVTQERKSFGLTSPSQTGFYLQDSYSFFNSDNLIKLYDLLSQEVHISGKLTPAFDRLLSFETELYRQYLDYFQNLAKEKGVLDPNPRGLEELNLRWND